MSQQVCPCEGKEELLQGLWDMGVVNVYKYTNAYKMSPPPSLSLCLVLLEVKNKPFTTLRLTVLLKTLARDETKGHSSSGADCPPGRREKEKLRKQVGIEEAIVQSRADTNTLLTVS